jgi:hypothetical protein
VSGRPSHPASTQQTVAQQRAVALMLRNDLIVSLSEKDNDAVTVNVNGILIDVDSVSYDRESIVLVLDPEDLRSTLTQVASGRLAPRD